MKTKRFRGVATSLECQRCHKRALIRRAPDSKRKEGHIKHLFCIRCKTTTAHAEVRSVRSQKPKENDDLRWTTIYNREEGIDNLKKTE